MDSSILRMSTITGVSVVAATKKDTLATDAMYIADVYMLVQALTIVCTTVRGSSCIIIRDLWVMIMTKINLI